MIDLPKQIVSHDIPYDTNNSEAYVYKYINLSKDNKTYGGKRLGKPDGSYICSSSRTRGCVCCRLLFSKFFVNFFLVIINW